MTRDMRAMTRGMRVSTPDMGASSDHIDVSTPGIFAIKPINRVFVRDTHVSTRVMSDGVQHILDIATRLRELRGQLDRLDAERAEVKRQIDECTAQMGAARDEKPMPQA